MSSKLLLTYPHREEHPGIDLEVLLLCLVLLKGFSNQLKIVDNLTFSKKVWPFCLFGFTLCWAESAVSAVEKKWHFGFIVAKMSIFKVYFLWLKKSDAKMNLFLVISDLMASFKKVFRSSLLSTLSLNRKVPFYNITSLWWQLLIILRNLNIWGLRPHYVHPSDMGRFQR